MFPKEGKVFPGAGVRHRRKISCADGHSYREPTVRFEGGISEGLRAVSIALAYGLPVVSLRRAWEVVDGMLHGPWWEMTFTPPRPTTGEIES